MNLKNLIYEAQKKEFSRRHITKNFLKAKLDTRSGFVSIAVQYPLNKLVLIDIVIDAYLKLGVNCIKYCIQDNNSYNLFVRVSSNNDSNMVSTVEQSVSTFGSSVVAIDELASKANLSKEQVIELLEESQIPVLLQEGNIVLSRNSAFNLISNLYNQKRDSILNGIFSDAEGTKYSIEEVNTSSDNNSSVENNGSYYDSEMRLPQNFDIMAGRKRRPDIVTGLKICIEALSGGNSTDGMNHYISEIISKSKGSKKFLDKVAEYFPNKKAEVVVRELKAAAIKIWDEGE